MIEGFLAVVAIAFAFAYNNERGKRDSLEREVDSLKCKIKDLKRMKGL